MLIDIHSHINNEEFLDDVEDVIKRAQNSNVKKIVCVGCDYKSSISAINLANKFKNVYAVVGFHPNSAFDYDKNSEKLILQAKENKKIIAIGEIGLDYNNLEWQIENAKKNNQNLLITKENFIEKQKEVFLKQLKLANEINLPVVIHMREATNETLKLLEENQSLLSCGGIIHCFNGSLETVKRIFDLGLYISIGGTVTFKNSKFLPSVLANVGFSKIMLETDCPFLSPEPFRGKRNEPKNIQIIAQKIANLTYASLENVENTTTENALKVFPKLNNWGKIMFNFKFKKEFGQNFIFDENLLNSIVLDSGINKKTDVLEIGAGAGTLTKKLCQSANMVVSYEIDKTLKEHLTDLENNNKNLKIIFADALKESIQKIESNFPNNYVLVANLPYYITSPIIFKFLQSDKVESITVMVQKEVALRYLAKPKSKDYGIPTVMINYSADIKFLRNVNRKIFVPSPNVDSSLIKITKNFNKPKAKNEIFFFNLVKKSFANRRKTLVNNLQLLNIPKNKTLKALSMLGKNENVRAEELSITDFIQLSDILC